MILNQLGYFEKIPFLSTYFDLESARLFREDMETYPKNEVELKRAILQDHLNIDKEQLKKACLSVYDRCKLCVAQKGGRLEYTIKK